MKKTTYSLVVLSLLSTSLFGEVELVDGWQLSGDIRAGWVDYNYGNEPRGIDANGDIIPTNANTNQGHINSHGFYTSPKLSIHSPKESRIRAKATLAGVTDFGINDEQYANRTVIFDANKRESFALLQEAYISYQDIKHKLLVGREEFASPMVDADDAYMLANSFEVAYYQNSSIKDTKITAGYLSKMAGVWDSGSNGTEFKSMSQASFLSATDKAQIGDKGIYFAALQYNDKKHHDIKVWDYYAQDMYNTLFLEYIYNNSISGFSYEAGIQFINFKEVGYIASSKSNTKIDYSIYSLKLDGAFESGFDFSTGFSKYSDGEGTGVTLGAFGGYPYYATGMNYHYFEPASMRNAASYKLQLGYNFKNLGVKDLCLNYRYTHFDLDSSYSKNLDGLSQDKMNLNGIKLTYGKKLGAYFSTLYEYVDLDNEPNSYVVRLFGGYRF